MTRSILPPLDRNRPEDNRPMACAPWTSYRYWGRYGWIFAGAMSHAEALREVKRSLSYGEPDPAELEVWSGSTYRPAFRPRPARQKNCTQVQILG